MPPKANRSRVNDKTEIAEKVREIKQRQETWFKQRDQQKARSSPTEGHKSNAPRHVVRQTHIIHKGKNPSNVPLPDATKPNLRHVKQGSFKTYLQNQQDAASNGESVGSSYEEMPQDGSSPDRLLSRTHQRSLSPEMFDALADQIIHKVKRELRMDGTTDSDQDSGSRQEENMTSSQGLQKRMPSHHCQICSRVMMGPDCSPQLLIPCGHTFCAGCVEPHCPACGTPVQTVTPNLMLQQVITEYLHHNAGDNSVAGGGNSAAAGAKRGMDRRKQKTTARNLSGEYEMLTMRCEVLAAEGNDINARIEDLEQAAKGKLREAERVREQKHYIDVQIEQLREQQRSLVDERDGFVEESERFRDQVQEEEGRLNMITSTIRALRKDMNKIKRLANGTPH